MAWNISRFWPLEQVCSINCRFEPILFEKDTQEFISNGVLSLFDNYNMYNSIWLAR